MSLRIRKDGTIWCAALTTEEKGDCYIDDQLHYELSVEYNRLITTEIKYHMANKGQWWWKGQEPKGLPIDYHSDIKKGFFKNVVVKLVKRLIRLTKHD